MDSGQVVDTVRPVRRRRRPALSCVECRRRKIKCDQQNPCGHCSAKDLTCLFNSSDITNAATAANRERNIGSLPQTPLSANSNPDQAQTTNPVKGRTSSNLLNRFPTPADSSSETFLVAELPQFPRPSSTYPPSLAGAISTQTAEHLVYRVQELEQRLAASSHQSSTNPQISSFYQPPPQPLRGTLSKTRLFGQSHWITSFEQLHKLHTFFRVGEWEEIHGALLKCKDLARAVKAKLPTRWAISPDLINSIPSRELADDLVHCYLRTFESAFRVLHIPTFEKEYAQYWMTPEAASSDFIMKFLLVMAIGSCIYQNAPQEMELRSRAVSWIYAAQSWLSAPFEKSRLSLSSLQIHCLLLLARQTNAVGSELVWISSGSLLRTAMQMGLHRDPKNFPRLSVLHSEIRRRIWITILELATQSCIDSGMQPFISLNDFDTDLPSNVNDDELDENTKPLPPSKPENTLTQVSVQLTLYKSLPTRLEVVRLINDFHSEPPYDEVLRLSGELIKACRDASTLTHPQPPNDQMMTPESITVPQINAFHRNMLENLLRRFLLALHRPSALKARTDPHFHFSRKIFLDSGLSIITPEPDADYARLLVTGGGFFREVLSNGAFTVCLELITQLEEDGASEAMRARTRPARLPMLQAVKGALDLAEQRVRAGENNINGHLFLSGALAQVDAMEAGESPEGRIFEAAKRSVALMHDILKARASTVGFPSQSPSDYDRQMLDGQESGVTDLQGLDFFQDGNVDFNILDSWLLAGWEENSQL